MMIRGIGHSLPATTPSPPDVKRCLCRERREAATFGPDGVDTWSRRNDIQISGIADCFPRIGADVRQRRHLSGEDGRRPGEGPAHARCASRFGCSLLRALSAELALKFLAYLRSGAAPSGHDLWELYDGLDRATKDVIETIDTRTRSASTFPPVGDILKANRDRLRFRGLPLAEVASDDAPRLAGASSCAQRPRRNRQRPGFPLPCSPSGDEARVATSIGPARLPRRLPRPRPSATSDLLPVTAPISTQCLTPRPEPRSIARACLSVLPTNEKERNRVV